MPWFGYTYILCISLFGCVTLIVSVGMDVLVYLHNVMSVSSGVARISGRGGFFECTIPWNFRIWSKYFSFQIFTNVYIVKCNMSIRKLCSCLAFYDYNNMHNNTQTTKRNNLLIKSFSITRL